MIENLEKMSISEYARRLKVSRSTVGKWVKQYDIRSKYFLDIDVEKILQGIRGGTSQKCLNFIKTT